MSTEHGAATAANGGDRNGGAEASVTATDDNDGQAAPYQLLPALSEAEYAALRESIAEHGVRVPIEVDEDGNILDGHHRAAIAADLGIDCPRVVVSNLDTEQDKRTVALMLNLSRRHLTREQKREVIAASITADPDLSDREHARRCGVSPTTVGTVRKELEVSKLDRLKKKISETRARLIGMELGLVDLVLRGELRDDVALENLLRRMVPKDVPNAHEIFEPVNRTVADNVRGRLRHHDAAQHDATLATALRRYGIHGVCRATDELPWMTRSEFDGLKESAMSYGWIDPVTVTIDGDGKRILVDGRCRLVASMDDGVPECPIEVRDIDNPDRYSFSMNVYRANLTPDEVAAHLEELSKLDTAGEYR